jgi:acetyl-CoA acetyltransferase
MPPMLLEIPSSWYVLLAVDEGMERMRDVLVAGVGMTRFAKQPDQTLRQLTRDAVVEALADAGLEAGDVEAAFYANAIAGAIVQQEMVAGQVALRAAGIAGVPVVNVENACASASTALHLGWQAVASGQAERVLVVGAEKMTHPDKQRALVAIGRAVDVEEVFGPDGPQPGARSYFMDLYADMARAHMDRTGSTREDFAAVAAKNHRHGARNPRAQYGGELSAADVLAAREVVWPLTLPMCSPVSDGAAAAVLVSAEALGDGRRGRAVRIAASVLTSGAPSGDGAPSASERASRAAYERAGLGPEDLDLVELHDAAAPAEVILYEQLGLAPAGEGARLVRDGTTALTGRLPVNTSGGLLSKGHPIGATGLAQVHEATTQLRGEAAGRQVEGARTALCENGGGWLDGDNAAVAVHVLTGAAA